MNQDELNSLIEDVCKSLDLTMAAIEKGAALWETSEPSAETKELDEGTKNLLNKINKIKEIILKERSK